MNLSIIAAAIPSPELQTDAATFPLNLLQSLFGEGVEGATTTIEILLLLTVLTLVPSILILMTSFTRIVIVLSFTRNAMGTQQMPPNQVIIGLALFLTYFTMYGTLSSIYEEAWVPYQEEIIEIDEAYSISTEHLRTFMFGQIRQQENAGDITVFMSLAGLDRPDSLDDIPTYVLIPAFVTNEIKTAMRMGFFIFIPFIVIDMVTASALMSMGMMMLPPAMISLPFKLMLFVLVNGWDIVINNIVRSITG
jgi:flagellar biosynthetic protein FliP